MEYNEMALVDVVNIKTGKLNSNAAVENGVYPFFTCAPEPLRIDRYKYDQSAILLAGNNADGNFHINYFEGKFEAYQRTYIIDSKNVDSYDLKYIFYALKECLHEFKLMSQGTSTKFLTMAILNSFKLKIPGIEVQRKISGILSTIDEKIATNNQINRNLSEQAQVIFESWFVTYEKFGGEIPSDWTKGVLGDIAEIRTTAFKPDKEPDVIVEHYSIPALDEKHFPVFEMAEGIKSNKYLLNKNSVMISKLNPDTKRIWRPLCLSGKPVCSTEFIVFEAKNKDNKDFIYSILDSVKFSNHLCSHVTGSTGSRQRAVPKATLDFEVMIPPQETIEQFCSVVTPVYDLIASNEIENQRLSELRDNLLPKLMSGELDVSDLDI